MMRITFLIALIAPTALAASHADLNLDLTVPARLEARQPQFSGSVRNNGPDRAENVVLTVTTSNGQHFEIPLGTVYPVEGRSFTLVFPKQDADFLLDAKVSSATPDPDPVNNALSGPVSVSSAPKLSFYFGFPVADPGELVLYETHITNQGLSDANGVTFTIPIGEGWSFVESLSPRMRCVPIAGDQARCTVDKIAVHESFAGRFTLRAPNRPGGDTPHVDTVAITSDRGIFDQTQSRAAFQRAIYRHLTVTTTADDGAGSLRQAMLAANAQPKQATKIVFDIAVLEGERVATIEPLTPLPVLRTEAALFVDGTFQTARRGDTNPDGPEIEISGSNLTAGSGLESAASAPVEFRGLVVNAFPASGIIVSKGSSHLVNCYVGTDVAGRRAVPNRGRGVVVSSVVDIENCVISGNGRSGIFLPSGNAHKISNSRIGVAAGNELLPLGNGASGIFFGATTGYSSVTGNVIGFNRDAGIALDMNAQNITMSANAIADNGGLPIDYGIDGVTPNAAPSRPVPPFPTLTAARYDAATGRTIVEGQSAIPWVGSEHSIDLFASETAQPRQAALFLGSVSLTKIGNIKFHFEYEGDLRGRFITATFTEANSYYPELYGNRTSELSDPIAVAGEATAPLRRLPRGADVILTLGREYQSTRLRAAETSTVPFSYRNAGPEEAHDVVLDIGIQNAAEVRLMDGDGGGSCRQIGNERIVCTQARLAVGESFSASFSVKAPLQAAKIPLSAAVSASTEDADRSNNDDAIVLQVDDAPVIYVQASNAGPTEPDADASYDVFVQNATALPASDVALAITLAPGWSLINAAGDWQCTPGPSVINCKRALIGGGERSALTLTLRAPAAPVGQRRISNPIKVTTARPMAFDTTAFLATEVIRHYEVTTTADDGAGSLRDVITRANRECQRDNVTCEAIFNLPPPVPAEGFYSIRPLTPLPAIVNSLIIDATTQTRVTGDTNPLGPEVELDGGALAIGNGIVLHTTYVSGVRGLAINRFPEGGVLVDQPGGALFGLQRVIADCYIGTDPTGRTAAPNGLRGITVQIDPKYGIALNIFNNVIGGNGRSGIFIDGGSGARISNNRIGVAAGSGMGPLGNGASGIYLGSATNVLVDQNVIAFNHDVGVGSGPAATFIGVQRNVLTANGTLGIDYGLDGVTFNDSPDRPADLPQFPVITSAVWDAAAGVTRIEGIAPASRYVIDRGVIDVYGDSSVDQRGFGPAEEWLGQVTVEFSKEQRPFVLTVPRNLQGSFVAATFTRYILGFQTIRWTSELSATVPVSP